jgi:hypothetical protein
LDGHAALAQQSEEASDDHNGDGYCDEDVGYVDEVAGGGAGGGEQGS